jgi:uncharacterized protein (TIGR03067 family)
MWLAVTMSVAAAVSGFAGRLALADTPPAAAKGTDKEAVKQTDLDRLQGAWKAVSLEADGKKRPDAEIKDFRMVVRGNNMNINPGNDDRKATFTLDPSKKLKEIALKPMDGPAKGRTVTGIYRLEDDTLTLCIHNDSTKPADKPDSFKTAPGAGCWC